MKVLIVGGVAGGATAAARLRRIDENAEIIIFERGEYISYANCGLPYYIGDVITDRDDLLVQTVAGMEKKFNLDIRVFSEVVKINREEKTVEVKNLKTNEEYKESYDKLILSPGAAPLVPKIEGIESANNIFTLRTVPDTDKIKEFAGKKEVKKVTIVGGGFIGIEMMENLHHIGKEVTLVENSDQIMTPFDPDMANILQNHIIENGVNLILSDGVKSFEENGKIVVTNSGKKIPTDMTILAIGVRPENELAKDAKLELGQRGHIVVNEKLETSDKNIYALGDVIEFKDAILGNTMNLALAGPANRCARIVANNICGIEDSYGGFFGTSIIKIFDLDAGNTGLNEKRLKELKVDYGVIHTHPLSNAGYYPTSKPMSLKILFDKKTGRVLGAQAVGGKGIDKRIDVIATALYAKMTVKDLTRLELSYAPPFGSAKDAINLAGYAAENILDGLVETVSSEEVDELIKNGAKVIDVREKEEVDEGSIDGAINIPLGQIREYAQKLNKEEIYVSCQVGIRGYIASRILRDKGLKVKNVDGGYESYITSKKMQQKDREVIEKAKEKLIDSDGNRISCTDNTDVLDR